MKFGYLNLAYCSEVWCSQATTSHSKVKPLLDISGEQISHFSNILWSFWNEQGVDTY